MVHLEMMVVMETLKNLVVVVTKHVHLGMDGHNGQNVVEHVVVDADQALEFVCLVSQDLMVVMETL